MKIKDIKKVIKDLDDEKDIGIILLSTKGRKVEFLPQEVFISTYENKPVLLCTLCVQESKLLENFVL